MTWGHWERERTLVWNVGGEGAGRGGEWSIHMGRHLTHQQQSQVAIPVTGISTVLIG